MMTGGREADVIVKTATRVLIVLAKAPVAGVAKTRLTPPLTPEEAAAFAAASLADMLAIGQAVPRCTTILFHPTGSGDAIRAALSERPAPFSFALSPSTRGDIDAAMAEAIACAFEGGAPQVALIGSDLPSLPPAHITAAFAALDAGADVALGPAADGGYYLVATRQPRPDLFTGIAWSTPAVFAQTAARATAAGLSLATIPPWYDIDGAPDLLRCARDLAATPAHPACATRAFLATIMPRLLAGERA